MKHVTKATYRFWDVLFQILKDFLSCVASWNFTFFKTVFEVSFITNLKASESQASAWISIAKEILLQGRA